ncbi:MAG: hypothetical protein RMJ39_10400 [Deltaproteobacteria bacterium]|nr:hypothetical protein [Deltaproteobacteria bacterium]
MDGQLNHVGCEYGRKLKESLKNMELAIAILNTKQQDLEEEIEKMGGKMEELLKKTYWILGAFAFLGGLLGSIFNVLAK